MVSADVNGYGRMIVDRGAVVAHDRSGVDTLDNDRRANMVVSVMVNSAAGMAASEAASTESVSLIHRKSERSRDRDACE